MINDIVRRIVPGRVIEKIRGAQRKRVQRKVQALPALTADAMRALLERELGVSTGDLLFVHSSVDRLHLSFPFFQILGILREIIGMEGTLVFPTYPPLSAHRYLNSGAIFDVKKTPSYTGVLSEFARRQRKAVRSLHPTKSVAAIGPLAEEITAQHHLSPYPYHTNSPYYKTAEHGGRVIGVGVGTFNLSMVHCVDDIMGDHFPVAPYHPEIHSAPCVDHEGNQCVVPTYAHDMKKMDFDIPAYMATNIPLTVARDFVHNGMRFFTAEASPLYRAMTELATRDITIYRKRHYK